MTQDTKTQILKKTEKLIYKKGMEVISLRTIAAEAKSNVAAVNYHFGSKDNLVLEIFSKHLAFLDAERDKLLSEAEERTGNAIPSVADLVKAFLYPWTEFKKAHPQFMNNFFQFYSFYSRERGDSRTRYGNVIQKAAASAYKRFSEGVFAALPDVDRRILIKRMNMAIITAASYVINGLIIENIVQLSDCEISLEEIVDHLAGLIEHGLAGSKRK
jgi:AcrR family transcriptional regulator